MKKPKKVDKKLEKPVRGKKEKLSNKNLEKISGATVQPLNVPPGAIADMGVRVI